MEAGTLIFGPFCLEAATSRLLRDGVVLQIGHRGVVLLRVLAEATGKTVTKTELMERVWPNQAVEEGNLTVQIAALRKAMGTDSNGRDWILTVPREGYRLIAGTTASPLAPLSSVLPSLAVLPFQNLSGDIEQDYFADGIVEDIMTALSRFKSFVVVRNLKSANFSRVADIRQIVGDLGARYALTGSVRRAGDRLRITAQLVEGMVGSQLWSQTFDGTIDDIFDFQDRITESVASAIEPNIRTSELDRAHRERPQSVAAYDIYLQALAKILAESEIDNAEAHRLLTKALTLEPNNAILLAHAAWTLEHRITMGWPAIGPDDRAQCLELSRRGLEHAAGNTQVMVHCGIALVQGCREYDWGMAVVRAAVEANPNNLMFVTTAGVVSLHCGSIDDALAYFYRANRLSQIDAFAHVWLCGTAHCHIILGNYEIAIDWASRSLALNTNFDANYWMLVAANAHLGRMKEAKHFLAELQRLAPDISVSSIKAGQPAKFPDRLDAVLDGLRLAGMPES
jgi:TolB-like protein